MSKDKPGSMSSTLKAYRTLYDKFDVNKDQQVDLKEICAALGIPAAALAELLPPIEAVMVAKLNERIASGSLEGRDV